MQQYFDIESGSGILTVFHTEDKVSFDVEHYGGFSMPDNTLKSFLSGDDDSLTVITNPAEEHPSLAEDRPSLYPDEDKEVGELVKHDDGSLQVDIYYDEGDTLTVELTPGQTDTLEGSITVGEVERWHIDDDEHTGRYPVESVSRDGDRNRADS